MKHYKDSKGNVFGYDDDYADIPDGLTEITIDDIPAILEANKPSLTPDEKIADIENQIQSMLNAQARSMGYDNIYTAVTYADEPAVANFQQEGQALRAWRSQVWAAAYAILADWQAGNIAEPTADEVLAQLPVFDA